MELPRSTLLRLAVIVLLVLSLIALWQSGYGERLGSLASLKALFTSLGAWGPPVFIVLCSAGFFIRVPAAVMIAVGALVFGFGRGFVFGWIGAVAGAVVVFFFIRFMARDAFQRTIRRRSLRLRALNDRLERNGFITVLVLRLLVFCAPPLNWVIALSRVRFSRFLAGTALGVLPGTALICYCADTVAGMQSHVEVLAPAVAVPLLLAAALLAGGVLAASRLGGVVPRPPSRGQADVT